MVRTTTFLATLGAGLLCGILVLVIQTDAEALYVLKEPESLQPSATHPRNELYRPFFEDFHARVTRQFVDVPDTFGWGRTTQMDDPWDAWVGAARAANINGIQYPWSHPRVDLIAPLEPRRLWTNLSSKYGRTHDIPVIQLELIGLSDPSFPKAYVTEALRMKFLDRTPTRPLDFFERNAIAEFQRGAVVFFMEEGEHVRLVGAIRAGRECLACHAVNENALLGAFSYRLDFSPRKPAGELEMLEPVEYFPPFRFLE